MKSSTLMWTRRRVLRGMLAGGAVSIGLPILDCMLNGNGTAFADTGAPLPTRFPFPPSLIGTFAGYNGSDAEAEVRRILASRPRYLVTSSNWDLIRQSLRPQIRSVIDSDYRLVRRIVEPTRWVEIYRLKDGRSQG